MAIARRLLIPLTIVFAGVLLQTTPASAHWFRYNNHVSGTSILEGYGIVTSNHLTVSACDARADGNGVRTEYRTSNGGSDHVGDPDGNGGVCGIENSYDGYAITSIRVCISGQFVECNAWRTSI